MISYPQLLEIVKAYKPDVVWSDGDWERTDDYWKAKEFLTWLYNERSKFFFYFEHIIKYVLAQFEIKL